MKDIILNEISKLADQALNELNEMNIHDGFDFVKTDSIRTLSGICRLLGKEYEEKFDTLLQHHCLRIISELEEYLTQELKLPIKIESQSNYHTVNFLYKNEEIATLDLYIKNFNILPYKIYGDSFEEKCSIIEIKGFYFKYPEITSETKTVQYNTWIYNSIDTEIESLEEKLQRNIKHHQAQENLYQQIFSGENIKLKEKISIFIHKQKFLNAYAATKQMNTQAEEAEKAFIKKLKEMPQNEALEIRRELSIAMKKICNPKNRYDLISYLFYCSK